MVVVVVVVVVRFLLLHELPFQHYCDYLSIFVLMFLYLSYTPYRLSVELTILNLFDSLVLAQQQHLL